MSICADIRAYVCELDSLEIEFNNSCTYYCIYTTFVQNKTYIHAPRQEKHFSPCLVASSPVYVNEYVHSSIETRKPMQGHRQQSRC